MADARSKPYEPTARVPRPLSLWIEKATGRVVSINSIFNTGSEAGEPWTDLVNVQHGYKASSCWNVKLSEFFELFEVSGC